MSTNCRVETAFFVVNNPTILIKHLFKVQRAALDLTFVHFYGITPPITIAVQELRKKLNCISFLPLIKIPICFIKGQLISKCPFGVFKSPETNETFVMISALASKVKSKNRALYTLGCQINEYTRLLRVGWGIACHFSQDHPMVKKILDFIHKHPKYKLVKSFFYYLDWFFRNIHPTRLFGPTRLIGT